MYIRLEYSAEFISANWQQLSDLFSGLKVSQGIGAFRGYADPPILEEYTRLHWRPDRKNNIEGFGELLIKNANAKWSNFGIKFFDPIYQDNRFIDFKVDCKNKKIDMEISLEDNRGPEEVHKQIINTFTIKKLLQKTVSESSTSGKELEQKFKILFSEPQAKKDFDSLNIKAKKESFPIGILFVDIDGLKKLNSKYTETKVDKTILPEAQRLLKKITQYKGFAYRQGGDEFVIILPNYSEKEVAAFAETLLNEFGAYCFRVNGEEEKVTISIGFALFPINGDSYDDVLSVANEAKLRAKKTGGNIVKSVL